MFDMAVVDASPLIVLAKSQFLTLLLAVADQIVVPPAVLREVSAGPEDDPARRALAEFGIVQTGHVDVDDRVAAHGLGAGETEVLSFALRAGPGCIVVVDDAQARRCARTIRIAHVGCVGLVIDAVRRHRLPDVRAALSQLAASGLYLSTAVIDDAVRRAEQG